MHERADFTRRWVDYSTGLVDPDSPVGCSEVFNLGDCWECFGCLFDSRWWTEPDGGVGEFGPTVTDRSQLRRVWFVAGLGGQL